MSAEGFDADWTVPPTDDSPDHSYCRFCEEPITFQEVSYTHDSTGFADCGVRISGGKPATFGGQKITINPEITTDPSYGGSQAEPMEWNPPKGERDERPTDP